MSKPKPNKPTPHCPLCLRAMPLTAHHLIPKKMHRRQYFKTHTTPQQRQQTLLICRQCHDGIHRIYDEMTLAKQYNSLEKLHSDITLQRHFHWVSKQKRV